jgi:dTDP-4-dehydrorhamnose reductase
VAAQTKVVLIVGGSGLIGTHLALRMRESYKVFMTYRKHRVNIPGVTAIPCEVDKQDWVKRIVYTSRPDVVLYVAGQNSPEWAEGNQKDAERVHTDGAGVVSSAAEIFQPKFIYLSNCFVYDGFRGNYAAHETVIPTSLLGKVKVGGENAIRNRSLNYVIIRSSPVIGRGNGRAISMLDKLRMALDRNERIELSPNEVHSYAPIDGLVDVIARTAESGIRNKILHYGGLTRVSQLEFGRAFAKRFGYDGRCISPRAGTTERKFPQPGKDPLDFSLNSTQTMELLKIKPLFLEESFDLIEKKLVPRL